MLNFVKSLYSGLCIGLGGTAYLSCDNKILGAFLFGLGLFTILNFGFNLFTGKVGYFVNNKTRYGATLQAKANALCLVKDGDSIASLLVLGDFSPAMLQSLVVVTIGNSIGGGLIPLMQKMKEKELN